MKTLGMIRPKPGLVEEAKEAVDRLIRFINVPSPNSPRALKLERKIIKSIVRRLEKSIPMTAEANGVRRRIISDLLMIAAIPSRHTIPSNVVTAAVFLLSYNDRVALALLREVVKEYATWISAAREFRKAKQK